MTSATPIQTALRPALTEQALGYFALSDHQKQVANTHYRALGNNPTPKQIELFELDKHNYEISQPFFEKLPKAGAEYFRTLYIRQFKRNLRGDGIAHMIGNVARREANLYLRNVLIPRVNNVLAQYTHLVAITDPARVFYYLESLERPNGENGFVKSNRKPLYLYTKKEIERFFAMPLAAYFEQQISEFGEKHQGKVETEAEMFTFFKMIYHKIGKRCAELLLPLPNWGKFERDSIQTKHIESDLSKACCYIYWSKKLHATKIRMAEHIAIATGQVNKHSSPYVSAVALENYKEQKRKNFDFIKNQILINIDDPEEQTELLNTYVRSNSNPAIRRIEMMNRLRGIEEWADSQGDVALFLTLTAPSSFHAYHSKGGFNAKWEGASPKATQEYLCSTWAKMRAAWARADITYYGMRVAEPHHDGTPHWHILVYLKPKQEDKFSEIFRRYALEVDGDEKGAQKHRCKIEKCDPKKGTATGYIAKYIAKNIDGYALDGELDDETGKPLSESARRVTAWACLWRLRQFQMFGQPPISVWRELRRLGNKVIGDDDRLDILRVVCDAGDFACYIREQGGTELKRDELLARVNYVDDGQNAYMEPKKKINGIYNQLEAVRNVICTRLKKWLIARKPSDWNETQSGERSETEKNSGLCPPWTCVNNCTGKNGEDLSDFERMAEIDHSLPPINGEFFTALQNKRLWLHKNGLKLTTEEQRTLLIGGKVRLKNGKFLSFERGHLSVKDE